jgi:hypothetical protein
MILLLIIPSWILTVSIVVALCLAARRGEEDGERRSGAAAGREHVSPTLAATEGVARLPTPATASSSFAQAGGRAA